MRLTVLLRAVLCAVAAYAQAPSSKPSAAGLEPAWDMAVVLQEIGDHVGRLLPALNHLNASAWVASGASDTYVAQQESSRRQVLALIDESQALSRNPEKLSGALQLFFRMEGLETMLNSLQEGARKYQGPLVAQSLAAIFAEGGANRERLRSYIINLAAEREQQFEVMDREAQRCRGTLMAPPPPLKTSRRKK